MLTRVAMVGLILSGVLTSPLLAQPTKGPNGPLKGACGGDIPVVLDEPAFRAAYAKLKVPTGARSNEHYTIDEALGDARAHCIGVAARVNHLCEYEGNPPKVIAKLKTIRCTFAEGAAGPQQEFKDGTWTAQYTWWTNGVKRDVTEMNLAKALDVDGPVVDVCTKDSECRSGYECRAGICADPQSGPDPGEQERAERTKPCSSAHDCGAGQVCGRAPTPFRGPRCVEGGRAQCKRTDDGNPYGHADAHCGSGEWCSQYGVCLPKAQFPKKGHSLAIGQTCYSNGECATRNCVTQGANAFSQHVGACARR
jgi:hypothetical protein